MIRKKENEKAIYTGEENSMPQDRQKIDHKLFQKNVYNSQENTINRTN